MALEDIVRDMNSGGLGATWSAGQKYAADRASTLAQTAQTQANTDRTTQMTPSMVAQSQGQAEATRLGNLNPQEEEKQGLPGTNAQIKAQQAQQILKQIPQKVLEEAHAKTQKATTENLGIMVQTMEATGDMNKAIAAARAHLQDAGAELPQEEFTKQMADFDKAAQQAQQQYASNPSQWLGELKNHMYSIAGNQSLSSPEQQGKLQIKNMELEASKENTQTKANALLGAANVRADAAKAAGPKGMNKQQALQYWGDMARAADKAGDEETYQYANSQFQAVQGAQQATGVNLVTGEATGQKPKVDVPRANAPIKQDTSKITDYLKRATDQADLVERVKALKAKGWTNEQIKAAHKG